MDKNNLMGLFETQEYISSEHHEWSVPSELNPNRSLEKASCHFLMTAIRKTALYMLDS